MAYITTEDVKVIRNNLKKKFPVKDGWKFSVVREDCSGVVVAIMSAPKEYGIEGYEQINHYYIKENHNGKKAEVLTEIYEIVSEKHWDESDSMTDYFHCAFYISIHVGKWDKDCVIKG